MIPLLKTLQWLLTPEQVQNASGGALSASQPHPVLALASASRWLCGVSVLRPHGPPFSSSGCPGHPTFQPWRGLFPLPGALPARGPGSPCSSSTWQLRGPSRESCPGVSNRVRPSRCLLPERLTVLLGTPVIIYIFVMVFLLPITRGGQGRSGLTHRSPGSNAQPETCSKHLLTA